MGPADYKADLDAVNLARRLQQSDEGLPSILGEYYTGIEDGRINRADEFVRNTGWGTLEQQREAFIAHAALQIQMENPARFNEADPLRVRAGPEGRPCGGEGAGIALRHVPAEPERGQQ